MQSNAYEPPTIKVAKLVRRIQKNFKAVNDPVAVKLFIATKNCSNRHKENLVEAYAIYFRSEGLTWNQPFYQLFDKKRRPVAHLSMLEDV